MKYLTRITQTYDKSKMLLFCMSPLLFIKIIYLLNDVRTFVLPITEQCSVSDHKIVRRKKYPSVNSHVVWFSAIKIGGSSAIDCKEATLCP